MTTGNDEIESIIKYIDSYDWELKYLGCNLLADTAWYKKNTPEDFKVIVRLVNSNIFWVKYRVFAFISLSVKQFLKNDYRTYLSYIDNIGKLLITCKPRKLDN